MKNIETCQSSDGCKTKYCISGMPEYWKGGILEWWMIGKI